MNASTSSRTHKVGLNTWVDIFTYFMIVLTYPCVYTPANDVEAQLKGEVQ